MRFDEYLASRSGLTGVTLMEHLEAFSGEGGGACLTSEQVSFDIKNNIVPFLEDNEEQAFGVIVKEDAFSHAVDVYPFFIIVHKVDFTEGFCDEY